MEVTGYRERFVPNQSQATRVFDCPWTLRDLFIQWALGYSSNSFGKLRRVRPQQHPEWVWMWAQEVELLEGIGFIYNNPLVVVRDQFNNIVLDDKGKPKQIPMIGYFDGGPAQQNKILANGKARLAVTYRALDWDVYSDETIDALDNTLGELNRWVTRDTRYANQALAVPNWQLRFEDDLNSRIPQGGILFEATKELIFTWHDVPDPPEDKIQAILGKMNDQPFDRPKDFQGKLVGGSPPDGFDINTLLFGNVEKKRHRSATGRVNWEISYHFYWREKRWDYLPDDSGEYRRVVLMKNGQPMYKQGHFDDLFTQPDTPFLWQGPGG